FSFFDSHFITININHHIHIDFFLFLIFIFFVSEYKQQRYLDIGITKYEWSTSNDERVRDDHKQLDGKIFSFKTPPVVDRRTGRRANPAEDFGCRCVAIPILP
ncbi:unnamed protein product, partial [marine sediment metagenome]